MSKQLLELVRRASVAPEEVYREIQATISEALANNDPRIHGNFASRGEAVAPEELISLIANRATAWLHRHDPSE